MVNALYSCHLGHVLSVVVNYLRVDEVFDSLGEVHQCAYPKFKRLIIALFYTSRWVFFMDTISI